MIERGSAAFWRTNLALFSAGLATFALLYCVQPLMPVFSGVFGISAARSSLSLSVTTLPLAFAMLGASALSDRAGRKGVMVVSLLVSAVLCGACALAPGFNGLLAVRALMGISLAGLPAIAMAYVTEEMAPSAAGLGMGLYIGGSAIGGMCGRLLSAVLAEFANWRVALAAIAVAGVACGLVLWRALPPSAHFRPHETSLRKSLAGAWQHLNNPVLCCLFAEGFLLMGGFVTVYNYVGYRLLAPPYHLGQGAVGSIFSVYLVGVASSALMGQWALRAGRRRVMAAGIVLMAGGVALTLAEPVWAIILGVAAVTAGFFGAHSVASAWVGFAARGARAQASALYLFAYYAGSSVVGSAMGLAWVQGGWKLVVMALAVVSAAALGIAWGMPKSRVE